MANETTVDKLQVIKACWCGNCMFLTPEYISCQVWSL